MGCRSDDCDECYARRKHAKHEHCLHCGVCLDAESMSSANNDYCIECVPCGPDCTAHQICCERREERSHA